ncbi:MAG: hypothetical protein RMM31_02325 [Anaerolineae bacterium]|nr:hypothetical protein [Thermoflexales bacterium]MDW8395058.1 hypothetical protein [Anaerolineae bacterium]
MSRSNPASVCANIGPKERQKRLLFGIFGLAIALVLTIYLRMSGAPWWTGLVTLPFFLGGWTGLFQWQHRVCIANVRRNVRNMDEGYEPVTDEQLRQALEAEAAKVQAKALGAGLFSVLAVSVLGLLI